MIKILHTKPLSLCIALICANYSVFAKDEKPSSEVSENESTEQLETVQVTATRRPENIVDVPAFASVVVDVVKPAASNITIADALRGTPGVFVQQTTPGQGNVIVRGLIGSEVLHLVDGFRVNNTIFRNAPNQYLALVNPDTIGRIELIRGPASTLYGGDAMGGALQFITREPEFNEENLSAHTRLAYASADARLQARAEAGMQSEAVKFWLGISKSRFGNRRDVDGEQLSFTDFTQDGADLHARFNIADQRTLSLDYSFAIQPETQRYDALVAGFGQARAESATHQFEPQIRRFAQVRLSDEVPNSIYDRALFQIGQQKYHDDRRLRDTATVNEDRERNQDTLLGLLTQFDRTVGEASEHQLTYGLEFYDDEVESSRTRRNIITDISATRVARFPTNAKVKTQAIYLVDDWKREGRFDLNAGMRFTRYQVDVPAQNNSAAVNLDLDDVTGHIGANFKMTSEWHLVGNLGRGFRAPNIFDLGTFGDRPGNRFNIPNPNLAPESINSLDLGVKYESGQSFAQLALFKTHFNGRIGSVETGQITDTGRIVVQSQNLRSADISGVEIGTSTRLSERYQLDAALNWTRGEEDFNGQVTPADRIAPLNGRINLRRKISADWQFELESIFAARQDRLSPRDATDPRINPNGTGGFAIFNLRTSWQATDQLTLGAAIENLNNKKYREHGSGIDQAGRGLVLTIDWQL